MHRGRGQAFCGSREAMETIGKQATCLAFHNNPFGFLKPRKSALT